jgi:hypothetical protein
MVEGVELYGEDPAPYKIDVLLEKDGRLTVVDWKTKQAGKLDDRWVFRETRSWQSKIYAAALATARGPEIFPLNYEVRGVTLEEEPKVKTIRMSISRAEAVAAVRYLQGTCAMKERLVERGRAPWPQHTQGCQMFGPGYPCEFEAYCWHGEELPDFVDVERLKRPLSHSSAGEFLRCPERYRLLRLMGKSDDDESGNAGTCFHAAMEEVYRQVQRLQRGSL